MIVSRSFLWPRVWMMRSPQHAMIIAAATAFVRLSRGQLPICHPDPARIIAAAAAAARGSLGGAAECSIEVQ